MEQLLMIGGAVLLVLGFLWPMISKLGLGRLPGDIAVERPGFRFYAPITTSLLVSLVLSLLLWLFR